MEKLNKKKLSVNHYISAVKKNYTKDFKGAINECTKAIKLDKQCYQAYWQRAHSKFWLGQFEDAISDCNKAIKYNSKFHRAYYIKGLSFAQLQKFENALKEYDKAIRKYENDQELEEFGQATNDELKSDYYVERAICKYNLKRYKLAIDDYDVAINLGRKKDAFLRRGQAKAALGNFKTATNDYKEALFHEQNHAMVHYLMGESLYKQGAKEKAKSEYFKLVSLTRDDPPVSLFKFVPLDSKRLLSLIDNKAYLSSLKQLNDPMECDFLKEYSTMGECFKYFGIEPRICSMVTNLEAETFKSILMYAHYADNQKGICVEYDVDFDALNKQDNVAYGYVEYKKKEGINNLQDLYLLKHADWEYENEFRIVCFGNDEFIQAQVKSITFGLNCPVPQRQIIYNLLPENVSYFEILKKDKSNEIIRSPIEDTEDRLGIRDQDVFKLFLKTNIS